MIPSYFSTESLSGFSIIFPKYFSRINYKDTLVQDLRTINKTEMDIQFRYFIILGLLPTLFCMLRF